MFIFYTVSHVNNWSKNNTNTATDWLINYINNYLSISMELSPSEAIRHSAIEQFPKRKDSLFYIQQSAIDPYPEPDESSQYHFILFP